MNRGIAAALLLIAGVCVAPSAFAGWSLAVDAPLSYTFDNANVNKLIQNGTAPAPYKDRTTSDVSGYKVALIAPFHVGIGYEDYTVRQDVLPAQCTPCTAKFASSLQILDVLVDIPLRYVNLGLGYGMGTAQSSLALPPGAPSTVRIKSADVTQYFVTLGIPLRRIDLHVGYHWVTVQDVDGDNGGSQPFDKVLASGQMLSAGLRLDF